MSERSPGIGELVERDAELAGLESAVDCAQAGMGVVVFVEGAAGVGKTRLLEAARAQATGRGMLVLAARGSELERDFPFGVALQLFEPSLAAATVEDRARLLDGPAGLCAVLFDGGDPGGHADQGYGLIHGLRWLAAGLAEARGLLVAVDDLHWSDVPSLRFLSHLGSAVETLPVAIVAALRTDEPGTPEELRNVRSDTDARVLRPAPLSRAGVAELVRAGIGNDAAAEFCDACLSVTGGNPFLVHELLSGLRSEGVAPTAPAAVEVERLVPESVRRSVLVRLARLPREAGTLASAVAVLGDRAALANAASLAGLDIETAEAAADVLAAAGLVRPGVPLGFVHPLIAAAVYDDLARLARARAHRRAAELLASDGAPVEAVASHLVCSPPAGSADAVATLRAAAAGALARGDARAAERFLRRALEEPPAAAEHAELAVALAHAQAASGTPEAVERLTDAVKLIDDPRRRALALQELARLLFFRGEFGRAAETVERAWAELDQNDPLARELLADHLAATMFDAPRRVNAAARLLALVEAARAGQLPAEPALLAQLVSAMAAWAEPVERVREIAEAALTADPSVHDAWHGASLAFLAAGLIFSDAFDLAERVLADALAVARRLGSLIAYGQLHHWRAELRYHQGRLADAIADGEQSLEMCRAGWAFYVGWSAPVLARARIDQGDLAGARAAVALAAETDPAGMQWAFVLEARGRLELLDGDAAGALADFSAAGAHMAERYQVSHPNVVPWRAGAAIAAAKLGDRDQAQRLAQDDLDQARAIGLARPLGAALRTAGRVTGGRRGIELLAEAVEVLERSPAQLEHAKTLVDLGDALLRAPRPAAAREPLRRGLELADAFGAAPLAEHAHELLLAAGARPRRAALAGPDALTPTERHVAELASQGLSNAQIASTMVVTVKTVEWHLTHAYTKLDVHARTQLHAALSDARTEHTLDDKR